MPFPLQYSEICLFKYTNPGLPFLKSAWDLVYPGQNDDVKEILRNLIECLEKWEL